MPRQRLQEAGGSQNDDRPYEYTGIAGILTGDKMLNNRIFIIDHDQLKFTASNAVVPDDEPIFVLLARDKNALGTIRSYQSTMGPTSDAWKIVQDVIDDFTKFKDENPDKMGHSSEVY